MPEEDDVEALLDERAGDAKADTCTGASDKGVCWLGIGALVGLERMRGCDEMESEEADGGVGGRNEGERPYTSQCGEERNPESGNSCHC